MGSACLISVSYTHLFLGLKNFKNKFNPEWRPKYIALSGNFGLPSTLNDIAAVSYTHLVYEYSRKEAGEKNIFVGKNKVIALILEAIGLISFILLISGKLNMN